jgi:hypothetical protein
MSAEVLPFRQKPVKGTQKRQLPQAPRFVCECEGDNFRIYADMRIFCVACCRQVNLDRGIA